MHGVTYGIPFALIGVSVPALAVIILTHVVIDRYRLAKYLIWAKNQLAPKAFRPVWHDGRHPKLDTVNYANKNTGYSEKTPDWMAVWLMVIADNTVHLVINIVAILVFGTIWV